MKSSLGEEARTRARASRRVSGHTLWAAHPGTWGPHSLASRRGQDKQGLSRSCNIPMASLSLMPKGYLPMVHVIYVALYLWSLFCCWGGPLLRGLPESSYEEGGENLASQDLVFFCAIVLEVLRRTARFAETVILPCKFIKSYCGYSLRRRIRAAATAQTNVKVLARETPQRGVICVCIYIYIYIHTYIYMYIYIYI